MGVRKNRSERFCPFGCHPVRVALSGGARGATLRDELIEERLPRARFFNREVEYFGGALERLRQCNQGEQTIVQFVGVTSIESSFLPHFGDRSRVEPANFVKNRFGQHTAHFYSPGAALFERCIVEVGKRIRIQYLV